MSKIDDLIAKYCPNGVEYKKLVSLAKIETGKLNANAMVMGGQYKFFTCSKNIFEIDKYRWDAEAILIAGNGDIGLVHYFVGKFDAYQRTYVLTEFSDKILAKYLHYCLLAHFRDYALLHTKEGSVPYVTLKTVEGFEIPIPPLPVQEEIVRILDSFSMLEAELEAELEARKKQYEHYKQKCFDICGEKKRISDIATIKARVGWQRLTTKEYLKTGDYYLITGTDFRSDGTINFDTCVYVDKTRYDMDENIQVHKNDILITKDGTLGKVVFLSAEPDKLTTLNSGVFRVKVSDKDVLPRFLYYYFTSKQFKDFVESVKTGSTVPHLTQQGLLSLNIAVPPLSEQERIVAILDKFDALVNDISIGLPAEIDARRKQYEYYRDRLLDFKELPNE